MVGTFDAPDVVEGSRIRGGPVLHVPVAEQERPRRGAASTSSLWSLYPFARAVRLSRSRVSSPRYHTRESAVNAWGLADIDPSSIATGASFQTPRTFGHAYSWRRRRSLQNWSGSGPDEGRV